MALLNSKKRKIATLLLITWTWLNYTAKWSRWPKPNHIGYLQDPIEQVSVHSTGKKGHFDLIMICYSMERWCMATKARCTTNRASWRSPITIRTPTTITINTYPPNIVLLFEHRYAFIYIYDSLWSQLSIDSYMWFACWEEQRQAYHELRYHLHGSYL